jgi:hypothetical protein
MKTGLLPLVLKACAYVAIFVSLYQLQHILYVWAILREDISGLLHYGAMDVLFLLSAIGIISRVSFLEQLLGFTLI